MFTGNMEIHEVHSHIMPARISTLRADVIQNTLAFTAPVKAHPMCCSLRSEIKRSVTSFVPFHYPAFKLVQVVLQKKIKTT